MRLPCICATCVLLHFTVPARHCLASHSLPVLGRPVRGDRPVTDADVLTAITALAERPPAAVSVVESVLLCAYAEHLLHSSAAALSTTDGGDLPVATSSTVSSVLARLPHPSLPLRFLVALGSDLIRRDILRNAVNVTSLGLHEFWHVPALDTARTAMVDRYSRYEHAG